MRHIRLALEEARQWGGRYLFKFALALSLACLQFDRLILALCMASVRAAWIERRR